MNFSHLNVPQSADGGMSLHVIQAHMQTHTHTHKCASALLITGNSLLHKETNLLVAFVLVSKMFLLS